MSKFSKVAHYQDFTELLGILERSGNSYDMDKIRAAYECAEKCHGDQRRVSGIPYILHPTSVACIVAEMGMDTDTICGALLHDVVEDTDITLDEVSKRFGSDVAKLIDGVTKISKIPYSTREEQQAENIRKMLIAMADDIRVIIIKLADRLHNMRTMDCMPEQKRRDKSVESIQVFAPIAHRLGIKTVKEELEDRSLQYLDPIGYKEIEDALLMSEDERERFIESIKQQILDKIGDSITNVYISGRVKSINSIYHKTIMRNQTMDQIFDVFAVRVIVDTVPDCYNVLGVVHDIFKPIPNRFKDYISMPKPNMYQSLHTTVLDKNAIAFEVQIRTWEMHYTAEYGIAAHWKYKLGMGGNAKGDDKLKKNIEKVKSMILEQLETEDATDIARNIRNDLGGNDVYVFTPKGDVMNLPRGSTPIDLAYLIHSQVGHCMVGAKINGKIVPIDYELQTGNICEIITQKTEHPNRSWLEICKTASAKSKIRQWFKHEKREENIAVGKQMLEREFSRQGINLTESEYPDLLRSISVKKQYNTLDDFYAAIGYGGIQLWKVMPRIKEEYQKIYGQNIENIIVPPAPPVRTQNSSGVLIDGYSDMRVKFSNCCNPLPGDEIIGYITRGFGVSIHKRNCTNVPRDLSKCEDINRWVVARWQDKQAGEAFRSTLQIIANDRTGFLADVTIKLSQMHIFIHTLNSRELKNGKAMVTVTINVAGRDHLRGVISKLSEINGIEEINRI